MRHPTFSNNKDDPFIAGILKSAKRWLLIAAEGSLRGWILDASEFLGATLIRARLTVVIVKLWPPTKLSPA